MTRSLQECLDRMKQLKEDTLSDQEHVFRLFEEFIADVNEQHMEAFEAVERLNTLVKRAKSVAVGYTEESILEEYIGKACKAIAEMVDSIQTDKSVTNFSM